MAQVEIIKSNLITEEINKKETNSIKKVCAYARVSTDDEDQLTSYNSQIEYYSSKIKTNPNWQFVGVYADEGISGTQIKNRLEFQRMIDDALNGKIDIIMTKSISRFARNVVDAIKTIRILRDNNIDVYFEKENLHTMDLDSEMFLTFYSAFAQAESESTSQNVKMGIKAKMKRGEPVGYVECFGYKWNKETKELTIVEKEAEIIRMIFNWYADGIGSRRIANKLNEMGIKSPKGNEFIPETIFKFINNEKYVGDLLQNKTYTVSPITHKKTVNYGEKEKYHVKNHHEPIISRELWDKCQKILSKRRKKTIPNGPSHNDRYSRKYPFSSKIKCGICGKNYVRKESNVRGNGKRTYYWMCGNRINVKDKCPHSITLRESILEETFIQIYNSIIENKYETKDKLLKAIDEITKEDNSKTKLDSLYQEKELLQKRLSSLIDMKLDDIENKEIYLEKEKELNSNIKEINNEIDEYEKENGERKTLTKKLEEINNVIDKNTKPLDKFNSSVFEKLIDKIVVGEIDDDNNYNSNTIIFFLNSGREYKYELVKNNKDFDIVSFDEHQRNRIFS